MAKLSITVSIVLLAFLVNDGEAVRCWTCSSDIDPLCHDPIIAGKSANSYLFRLDNCDAHANPTYPFPSYSRSVCQKQKKYIGNKMVVIRSCTWKRYDDTTKACPISSNGPNEVPLFCETCDLDGCNGA